MPPVDLEELVHQELPAEPASVGAARRLVARALRGVVDDDLLDVALVITSELTTNAMLHARTSFEIAVRRDSTGLRIEVQDGNPRLPRRKRYSEQSATGRGLVLVESLASLAGAEQNERGKVVWAVLVAAPPAPPVARQARVDDVVDLPVLPEETSAGQLPGPGDVRVAACDTIPDPVASLRVLVDA